MLVFVHVLLHPWVHAMGTAKTAGNLAAVCTTATQSIRSPLQRSMRTVPRGA